jgi:hypothetical protein
MILMCVGDYFGGLRAEGGVHDDNFRLLQDGVGDDIFLELCCLLRVAWPAMGCLIVYSMKLVVEIEVDAPFWE